MASGRHRSSNCAIALRPPGEGSQRFVDDQDLATDLDRGEFSIANQRPNGVFAQAELKSSLVGSHEQGSCGPNLWHVDLTREITSALRMRLTGGDEKRMAKSYTANAEAYQDYLKGRYWWNKRSEDALNKGIEYFQQAIEKDPTYALAYSGLADSYSLLANGGFVPAKDAYPRAREAAQKALEIDDTLAEAHASLALVKTQYDWDWSGAEREFQRAIALNPSYATAHNQYGTALARMGRHEEAIAEKRRAVELDPLSLLISRNLGIALYLARQYDQAIQQDRKTLELDPNYVGAHLTLGQAYFQKSMYKERVWPSLKGSW